MDPVDRFWIDDSPYTTDVSGWYAVVDEERGGIVAYFGREEDAERYVAWLRFGIENREE